MAAPKDRAAQTLQRLAALITQRRAALDWTKEKSAAEAGLAPMTYSRVEEGRTVQVATYAKIETAFGIVPGACRAILDGAESMRLLDGSELLTGGTILPVPAEWLAEEIRRAVANAAIGVIPSATGERIREMNGEVIAELRRRGILPPADD